MLLVGFAADFEVFEIFKIRLMNEIDIRRKEN